jgi:hypothetical protein
MDQRLDGSMNGKIYEFMDSLDSMDSKDPVDSMDFVDSLDLWIYGSLDLWIYRFYGSIVSWDIWDS